MKQRRVAYILSKYPTLSETFIAREIEEMTRQGISVDIFSLKNLSSAKKQTESNRTSLIKIWYFPYMSLDILKSMLHYFLTQPGNLMGIIITIFRANLSAPVNLLKTIGILPKILHIGKTLKNLGIIHIHAHWGTMPATACWVISTLNQTEYTFTTHAWDIFRADNLLEKKMKAANKVITISDFNKRYLTNKYQDLNPNDIEVIHVGLDFSKFRPDRKNDTGAFTILSVGRLVEKKGIQYLLQACRSLRDKDINFRCNIIYVPDTYKDVIFNLYKELNLYDCVEFISEVPHENIINFYRDADCFVLPCVISDDGDQDGIPTVIIEALATGLPVITSPISGIPEVIKNNSTGILINPTDISELTGAILQLYNDTALRVELGLKGKSLVEKEFNITPNVKRLMKIIFETE